MLCLTIWMLICWWGLSIEARESRKGSMAGSESCPQLISIRILTFLSNTAILMASSMSGQYLFDQRSEVVKESEDVKEKSYIVWWKQMVSFVGRVYLWGFSKRVVGKYSMTATSTKRSASEMMERIASRSWVLDGGQNDGGEPWGETQIWDNNNTQNKRNIWFIKPDFHVTTA